MVRTFRFLVVWALFTCLGSETWAQSPKRLAVGVPSVVQPDPLPGFPRPPEQPASLLMPAQPSGSHLAIPPGPYFEEDPRLDPPLLPQPGPFANVEMGLLLPHVKNDLMNTVQVGSFAPNRVRVPSAELDWTVSPRFELGYRLPSGFGEFLLGYRFLTSSGREQALDLDGPATLESRLEINTLDFDYASREWSLWPCWDMKWRFGLRMTSIYFDSHITEPLDAAAAGSGIFAQQTSNRFVGFGPHTGVELARRFDDYGLALVGRIDGWIGLGRLRQSFVEQSTAVGPDGSPLSGETIERRSQAVPQLTLEAGVRWEPPGWNHTMFFAGYQYEHWWNVGRDSNTPDSRGEVEDSGVVLRAEFNF